MNYPNTGGNNASLGSYVAHFYEINHKDRAEPKPKPNLLSRARMAASHLIPALTVSGPA